MLLEIDESFDVSGVGNNSILTRMHLGNSEHSNTPFCQTLNSMERQNNKRLTNLPIFDVIRGVEPEKSYFREALTSLAFFFCSGLSSRSLSKLSPASTFISSRSSSSL